MYKSIKKLIKNILPQSFLFKNEVVLRSLIYPFYKGDKHECNICQKKLKHFILVENGNLVCPVCGSLSRTRRLWMILNQEFLKSNIAILDFSPSRAIYRKLKSNPNIAYYSTDFEDQFLADYQYDITNINAEANQFDLIICYHILEHIEQDLTAMNELFRVLKDGGKCLIQTPFKEGEVYENDAVKTKEERLKHFGQEDHVRIYSIVELKKRLEKSGFYVEEKSYSKDEYFELSENETILICTKK